MQYAISIVRQPILIGLLLSIAIHAVILYSHGIYAPATQRLETGLTVVQLTLRPAMSSPRDTMPPQPAAESRTPQEAELQPAPFVEEQPLPTEAKPVTEPDAAVVEETTETASTEQDSVVEEDKGVTADALASSAFHPAYPPISRRRGEEGTVVLSVQVLANGKAGRVEILQTSGYHRLDEAAVSGARQTLYIPALLLGRTVDSTIELSYTFRLTND